MDSANPTLSAPPEGRKWHRDDFTPEMLPPGYRPLLLGEKPQEGDEWFDGKWVKQNSYQLHVSACGRQSHQRTKRPLPLGLAKPEWKLPTPPPGKKWHRQDWKEDMLPPGYRPLLLGEDRAGCEILPDIRDGKWREPRGAGPASGHTMHCRTTAPLAPLPGLAKPVWKLPDPPPGQKWHRRNDSDWTEEMLPDGYRPLLMGEKCENEDEFNNDFERNPRTKWIRADVYSSIAGQSIDGHKVPFRTKRPLPGVALTAACEPARVFSKIPTPIVDSEWDTHIKENLATRLLSMRDRARELEQKLAIAMDENNYQLARVSHFNAANEIAQDGIASRDQTIKNQLEKIERLEKVNADFGASKMKLIPRPSKGILRNARKK